MGSHFHSHQAPRHRAEHLHDGLLACAYSAFLYHLSVALQHAITAGLVSQVHTDRKAFFASFSAPLRTLLTSVILLHGRFSFCTSSASIREHIASRRGPAFSFHLGKAEECSAGLPPGLRKTCGTFFRSSKIRGSPHKPRGPALQNK